MADNKISYAKMKFIRRRDDWKKEQQRLNFIRKLDLLCKDWDEQYPDLRHIFSSQEIERLLLDSINNKYNDENSRLGEKFVEFVVNSGYTDEPAVDEDGKPVTRRDTPLHHAARCHRFFKMDFWIHKLFKIYDKFDVNYTDESGLSHFHVACEHYIYDVIRKFLELGQDPDCILPGKGDSVLHLALKDKKKEMVKLLLIAGADPNLFNKEGLTPVGIICDYNHDEYAKLFFEMKGDNQKRIQVDARDKLGRTPLHLALMHRNRTVFGLLLKNGADPNAVVGGLTPLQVICRAASMSDFAETLFQSCDEKYRPLPVNAQDEQGNPPLYSALMVNNKKAIELLLGNGADLSLANAKGSTPLHVICKNYELHCESDYKAERFFQIYKQADRVVQVNVRDKKGRTPLQTAVVHILPRVVFALLSNGADLSGFIFPTESDFDKHIEAYKSYKLKVSDYRYTRRFELELMSDVFSISRHLQNRGYMLDRRAILTILKFFNKHGVFEIPEDFDKRWLDDEIFTKKTKDIMVTLKLSLYDLLRLRIDEAANKCTQMHYKIVRPWLASLKKGREAVETRMTLIVHRKLFRQLALDSLLKLTRYRLPILCYEMIIDESFTNKDLYNVYLATADQSS